MLSVSCHQHFTSSLLWQRWCKSKTFILVFRYLILPHADWWVHWLSLIRWSECVCSCPLATLSAKVSVFFTPPFINICSMMAWLVCLLHSAKNSLCEYEPAGGTFPTWLLFWHFSCRPGAQPSSSAYEIKSYGYNVLWMLRNRLHCWPDWVKYPVQILSLSCSFFSESFGSTACQHEPHFSSLPSPASLEKTGLDHLSAENIKCRSLCSLRINCKLSFLFLSDNHGPF